MSEASPAVPEKAAPMLTLVFAPQEGKLLVSALSEYIDTVLPLVVRQVPQLEQQSDTRRAMALLLRQRIMSTLTPPGPRAVQPNA